VKSKVQSVVHYTITTRSYAPDMSDVCKKWTKQTQTSKTRLGKFVMSIKLTRLFYTLTLTVLTLLTLHNKIKKPLAP